ncbi:hypothetical protein GobsT_60860 [Gemmata obscuriglobus]|uniref:Uncharacterized protein n=1 Tax=Gemmata obscuriglobus TaxID=114 RepID=A0A2Z3GZ64_9BACT|nr:hypothetical protein [Gemmata obscuriglobus]AWM36145.1 hypothetical protein C1280_03405 [Gemmata obscuriglobus]QEG31265.1 hypothetical protein GobsT_60860 [Gemmata obscuriglobus]
MSVPTDPRAALARLVVQLRGAAPAARAPLVRRMLPLLAQPGIPLAVRYAAAARAIDALPDHPGAVRNVVRALTGRVPPARALRRLRHLQHLTERSGALDALVERRERKVKLTCPRCNTKLPRAEMAKHLWHEHRLELVEGKVYSNAQIAEVLRAEHTATGDPALIDRAAFRTGARQAGVWAAGTATPEETVPLCSAARERGVSLCPGCFSDIPPQVPDLPPELTLANGRLAGDGFVATAPVLSPPRVRATLLGAGVMLAGALVIPVARALVLSALAYLLGRALFRSKGAPDDLALNAAWRTLARKLTDRRDAARFLTRLCVTSVGRGDPFDRANPLNALVARANANRGEGQLLATALALRVGDSARFGRDYPAGLADLIAPVFRGERSADFAEHVLAVYFRTPRHTGELARLRALLLASAFEAECTPREVLALCDAAPHFARAARLSANHVAILYGVWANRTARPWEAVGKARTVFELAADAPSTATRLLAADPGLVLLCHPRGAEDELGPVRVLAGGVSIGRGESPLTVADPDADVRLVSRRRELVFGERTLRVRSPLPEGLVRELKGWLLFRAEVLAEFPAAFLSGTMPIPTRLLKPFVARCAACGAECLPAVGAVARPFAT